MKMHFLHKFVLIACILIMSIIVIIYVASNATQTNAITPTQNSQKSIWSNPGPHLYTQNSTQEIQEHVSKMNTLLNVWIMDDPPPKKMVYLEEYERFFIIQIGQVDDEMYGLSLFLLAKQQDNFIAIPLINLLYSPERDALYVNGNTCDAHFTPLNKAETKRYFSSLFKKIGRNVFEDINHEKIRSIYLRIFEKMTIAQEYF